MTTILILEGNTPRANAAGNVASASFTATLLGLDPDLHLRLAAPYAGRLNPGLFDQADGVVFTGSGEAWATNAPEAAPQRAAMQAAFATGLPVWGSCNGLQLAAVVLGGAVGASPKGSEIGMARDTRLTNAGRAHPMMAGRADGFAVPCIHRDEVQRLPEGAVLLAGNAHSPVQAMAYQTGGVDFWGTQYHPELKPSDIAGYVRTRGIHAGADSLADDLDRAERDPAAAARIGAAPEDLPLAARARELANWLAHVHVRLRARAKPSG